MKITESDFLNTPQTAKDKIEAEYLSVTATEGIPSNAAFMTAIPKGWKYEPEYQKKVAGPENPIIPLASFKSTEKSSIAGVSDAAVVIWSIFLPREMHGADWLEIWISSQAFAKIAGRQAASPYGLMGDVLATRRKDGKEMMHRMFTVKDGDVLYLIDGRVTITPDLDIIVAQEIFLLSAIHFKLLQPTKVKYAEGFHPTKLEGEVSYEFLASGLWDTQVVEDAPPGGACLLLSNRNGEQIIGNLIVLSGLHKDEIEGYEQTTLSKLTNQGFQIAEKSQALSNSETTGKSVQTLKYDALKDGNSYEVIVVKILIQNFPVLMVLVTPQKKMSHEIWVINRRALEIAIGSIKLFNKKAD
jgi:hypothetical protein